MVETIRLTIGPNPEKNERKTRRLFSRGEKRRVEPMAKVEEIHYLDDETFAPNQELLRAEKVDLLILAGITLATLGASIGLLLT